jgi:hypothetical protein
MTTATENLVHLGTRVPKSMRAALQTLADQNERSVSQEVRRAIRVHLNDEAALMDKSGFVPDKPMSAARRGQSTD